ncbi:MAG: hypothetical protein ACI8UO_006758 [Verrucomicrobiales bacterium]|jgi:hypothetical protein
MPLMIRTTISFLVLFAGFAVMARAVFRDEAPAPSLEIAPPGNADASQVNGPRDDSQTAPSNGDASSSRVEKAAVGPPISDSRNNAFRDRTTGLDVVWAMTLAEPSSDEPSSDEPSSDEPSSDEPNAEATKPAQVVDESEEETLAEVADLRSGTSYRIESLEAEASRDEFGSPRSFSTSMLERRERIRDTLAYYMVRPEDAATRSPWGVMHAIIAFGVETPLLVGGEEVNAVGWLCWNRPCRGMQLFRARDGKIKTPIGPGFQGHEGQFLAMMAQSKVKSDFPMRIGGYDFTIQDLVRFEQETCRPKSELTFKLIGLVHYLDSDAEWESSTGENWDIPRLIEEELAQPVIGAACGGTHRMMGFSYAVHKRRQRHEAFTGQWLRAEKFVDSYIDYTFRLQNRDGSFSTDWFRGPGNLGKLDRKLQTSGHMLEWLIFSLPQEDLMDPRVARAVDFVNSALWNSRGDKLEVGPKGHALKALALYDERVFGGKPGSRKSSFAKRAKTLSR